MANDMLHAGGAGAMDTMRPTVVEQVKRYFESRDLLRRGLCLLNAGCYPEAVKTFSAALKLNPDSAGLPECLARAYIGCADYGAAAEQIAKVLERDPDDITSRVRHALLLWRSGDRNGAIASLRKSIRSAPDCAELHYQLGNLLAEAGDNEEAEMRFTLAVDLDSRHSDALVNLAMCHAARGGTARALRLLFKAQSVRPDDARIGMLLGMACQSADQDAHPRSNGLTMPAVESGNDRAAEALREIVEHDPEIVDAFTGLPKQDVGVEVFQLLAGAIAQVITRRPNVADLHFHQGAVLDRLDRVAEAIASTERAVQLDPSHVRALIQLAKLYRRAGRVCEAVEPLERVLRLGVRYADVLALLGSLYRDTGRVDRARRAYTEALAINEDYHEAREALAALVG
jgi:tetratricopeptide (TPR) repeat protein